MSSAGMVQAGAGRAVAGVGASSQAPQKQYWEDFFVYEIDFGTVAVPFNFGTTIVGNIQIQADSDFKWLKTTCFTDQAGGAVTRTTEELAKVSLQILDGGSGRNLFQTAVPIYNIAGFGDLPFIMPIPRIFKARSTIQFTAANFSTGTAYNSVRLSLIGTKIFEGAPQY